MTDISGETFQEFMSQIRRHITVALGFLRPLIKGDQPAELLVLQGHLKKAKCIADGFFDKEKL